MAGRARVTNHSFNDARRFSTRVSHDRDNVPFQRPGVLEDRGNLDVYVRFWVTEWQAGFSPQPAYVIYIYFFFFSNAAKDLKEIIFKCPTWRKMVQIHVVSRMYIIHLRELSWVRLI